MSHCIDVICLSCGANYCVRCYREYEQDMRLLWLLKKDHKMKLEKEKCTKCGRETVYFE